MLVQTARYLDNDSLFCPLNWDILTYDCSHPGSNVIVLSVAHLFPNALRANISEA